MRCAGPPKMLHNKDAAALLHSHGCSYKERGPSTPAVFLLSPAAPHTWGAPSPHLGPPRYAAVQASARGLGSLQAASGRVGRNQLLGPLCEPDRLPGITASSGSPFGPRLPPDYNERGSVGGGSRGASRLHDLSAMLAGLPPLP
ncbi:hypothetical protein NDU88_007186 [Pleurodeles waltl]|uniref:Uncharacterized protein n=1 Tax=Pleurodeles waltl TaxID=8319 RepID=A0AAV7N9H8_PLEWA|nr:hypothetical protein NDU88_007186 [Pleurodeles waltl]